MHGHERLCRGAALALLMRSPVSSWVAVAERWRWRASESGAGAAAGAGTVVVAVAAVVAYHGCKTRQSDWNLEEAEVHQR